MSETEYGDRLWRKALRCGNVFSGSRLKSLFAKGLLPVIRTQVRHHLTTHPRIAFTKLPRYVEGMRTAYRGGKNYPAAAGGRDRSGHRTGCQQQSLLLSGDSFEPGSLEEVDVFSERPLAMAVETAAFPSPPGTHTTYFSASPGSTVPEGGASMWRRPNTPPPEGDAQHWKPPRQDTSSGTPCRLCLSRERPCCHGMSLDVRAQILAQWETNFQQRRIQRNYSPRGQTRDNPRENQSRRFRTNASPWTPPGVQFIGQGARPNGAYGRRLGNDREAA